MAPSARADKIWLWGAWIAAPEPEPVEEPARGLVILQFNVCGSKCNSGSVGGAIDALRDSILTSRPDLVLLNEVCLAQADRLWELLTNAGYRMSGALGITTGFSKCPGNPGECWYGNAVFSAGPGLDRELIALPNDPGVREARSAISMVTLVHGVVVRVSSAHLVPPGHNAGMNRRQMDVLATVHNRWAEQGSAVVFGGDFNTGPDEMAGIYRPAGQFNEVDAAHNRRTYGARKIDFIFMNSQSFYGLSAETKKSSFSDHRQLWGRGEFVRASRASRDGP